MGIKEYEDGDILFAIDLNTDNSKNISFELINHTKALQDRTLLYGANGSDMWGDAYIDSNGRNNSVAGSDNLLFNSNHYEVISGSGTITHDIPSGTFNTGITTAILSPSIHTWEDGNDIQYKLITTGSYGSTVNDDFNVNYTLSNTETLRVGAKITLNVSRAEIVSVVQDASAAAGTVEIRRGGYSGTIIDTATFAGDTATFSSPVEVFDNDILLFYNGGVGYTKRYTFAASYPYSKTNLNLVSGYTAGGTQTTTFAYSIQEINSNEIIADAADSGWLNYNEISEFSEFTPEPEQVEIKLIPVTGSLAIYGFGVYIE